LYYGLINYRLWIQVLYFKEVKLLDVCPGTLAERMLLPKRLRLSSRGRNDPTFWVKERQAEQYDLNIP
jgi:hypothetical protein